MLAGTTGFVCRGGDAVGFAGRILELARRADLRAEMSAHAREYALTRQWPHALRPLYQAWRQAAAVSATCRALIFLVVNLPAGPGAAIRAMGTEFLFRAAAAGFFGSMTETFARMRRTRRATAAALLVVPGIAHAMGFAVHYAAATPVLAASVAASVAFSMLTTLFNLHAMRCGALTVGAGSATLADDLRRMPALAASFVAAAGAAARGCRR